MNRGEQTTSDSKSLGFGAIGIFLFFGGVMAGLAATTLLLPGTPLDRAWTLNPMAYKQLSALGSKVGILFLLLAALLVLSGVGWLQRRLWGWRLADGIIATQVLGDITNLERGDWLAAHRRHNRRCVVALPLYPASQSLHFLERLFEYEGTPLGDERTVGDISTPRVAYS
jgi:hypothetical protein